jgi:hypothetical protein
MARRAQLLCAWCGPALVALLAIGLIPLAGFWPPPRPTESARQIAALYTDDLTQVRIGLCVMMAAVGLILPWGGVIVAQTRRIKTGSPVLPYVQLGAVAVATIIGVASIIAWGVAAFRPDEIAPETTRAFNDLGWLFFVFDWYVAVGLAILGDDSDQPVFPRWAGYLSMWVATLSVPGGLVICFKTGPFAFNGVLGIWVPLAVFFVWIVAMTALVIKAVNREAVPA